MAAAAVSVWGVSWDAPEYAFGAGNERTQQVKINYNLQTKDGVATQAIDLLRQHDGTIYTIKATIDQPVVFSADRKVATLHAAGTMRWNDAQWVGQERAVTVDATLVEVRARENNYGAGWLDFVVRDAATGEVLWNSDGHWNDKQYPVTVK